MSASITTIESIERSDGQLHRVQAAFVTELGPQCGFSMRHSRIQAGDRGKLRHGGLFASQHGTAHRRAYGQGGKCFLYGANQSDTAAVPNIARYIGIEPEDLVFIAEYCGDGFGS